MHDIDSLRRAVDASNYIVIEKLFKQLPQLFNEIKPSEFFSTMYDVMYHNYIDTKNMDEKILQNILLLPKNHIATFFLNCFKHVVYEDEFEKNVLTFSRKLFMWYIDHRSIDDNSYNAIHRYIVKHAFSNRSTFDIVVTLMNKNLLFGRDEVYQSAINKIIHMNSPNEINIDNLNISLESLLEMFIMYENYIPTKENIFKMIGTAFIHPKRENILPILLKKDIIRQEFLKTIEGSIHNVETHGQKSIQNTDTA